MARKPLSAEEKASKAAAKKAAAAAKKQDAEAAAGEQVPVLESSSSISDYAKHPKFAKFKPVEGE